MTGLSMPVSDGGSTTCSGSGRRPGRSPSSGLYQWTRYRLRGSAAIRSTPASASVMPAGTASGDASWAKVGSRMPCWRNRSAARASTPSSATSRARPSVVARYVEAGSTPSVLASESVAATGPVWQAGSQASS